MGQTTAPRTSRWTPELRRIDLVGLTLVALLVGWTWWAARQHEADAGPVVWLLLGVGLAAVLARWATFFHSTAPSALLAIGVAVYAISTGDDVPHTLGPEASTEAAGALFAVGTGAAALVALRLRPHLLRLAFGLLTVALAALTWTSGSLVASLVAGAVVLALVGFLGFDLREPRWVVVWPALVAVLVLLGTVTYGLLVPVGDEGLLRPQPLLHERWSTAIDLAGESPWYGVGRDGAEVASELGGGAGWVRHEPLQFTLETGLVGGLLLLALLSWALVWIAQRGWQRGSSIAGAVLAGAVIHACFHPIWHEPAVPLALAVLVGTASLRGGAASWRLAGLWEHVVHEDEPSRTASST